MNAQDYDIMNEIVMSSYTNQREIAIRSGYSVGKVNSSLKTLIKNQYIDKNGQPLQKTFEELKNKAPRNAIILAAGYGMRMAPINVETPKGMLEIQGEPLIERIIRHLNEVGVYEIDIVVGFMKEQYEYLSDKYGVNLVFNKDYPTRGNLYSLNCVADKIGNTYIIPCDIWCKENPFSKQEWYTWYMVTDQESEESNVRATRKKEVVTIKKEENGNKIIGIAYVLEEDARIVKKKMRRYISRKEYNHAFWEETLFDGRDITIGAKIKKSTEVYEINTYEQLRELDEGSNQLQSNAIQLIMEVLQCDADEIRNIKVMKKGRTNRSFEFECRDERYVMRIPGKDMDGTIDRKREYKIYEQLKSKNITESVIHMSPDTGYKIAKYIQNARNCDSDNPREVEACMQYLHSFHDMGITIDYDIDLFEQIEYYEKMWGDEPSAYRDYAQTKKNLYELKEFIDSQPKQIGLTQYDVSTDNFMLTDEKIYMIDWEYAGMQDIHVDVASFIVTTSYNRQQVDDLLRYYFQREPDEDVKTKIYCYIALCGLSWSNWCEYKRTCGVEFGEYSLGPYRYAKQYYKIAKERICHE